MGKLIVGYCRVSSNKQFEEGHALERYIENLVRFGIPESLIYFDVESGISDAREGFNSVMSLVKSGQVATVVIPNFDRLTRSPLQWEQAREVFTQFGVQVRFLEDGQLDLNSPDGLFTGRVKAALAAQVRDRIRSHAINGHRRHRERKEPYKPIFGYVMIDGKIRPNNDKYPRSKLSYFQVARALVDIFLELRSLGATLEAFKTRFYMHPASYFGKVHLKAPSSTTGLKRWLSNAMLRGQIQYLSFGRTAPLLIVDGEHEPLIIDDEWQQIKSIFDNNLAGKRTYDPSVLINPLSGIAKCKHCGGSMSQRCGYKRNDGEYSNRLLVCRNARNKNGRCKPEYTRGYGLTIEKAESAVQLEISARAEAIGVYVPDMKEINPEILELRQSIKMLEAIDDPDLVEVIERKRTRLQLLIETEEIKTVRSEEKKQLLEMVSHPDFWVGLSASERNAIYRDLVEVVWCDKGKLTAVLLV
ncbi:MAG: fdxN element excision recombinase XisF [Cyanobacteria bacterium P01_A01_bin.84]|uniref:Resolvase domain-containing protein n=1 Tax=Calothrix parasitica NIES-267 TaxID=1973488 RepID=A0A1Z4LYJ3_9CYAN|nr:resolvase domain-containing protein [Calothrix parasitica NIES-267]